jgi:hypothetical protein
LATVKTSLTQTGDIQKSWGRFAPASREDNYRILGSSQGPGGSGKTHFWLTAPDPIAVMLFDPIGLEGLTRQPLFKDKDIRVIEYKFNPGKLKENDRAQAAQDALGQFIDDYNVALKMARTIVWDKEDYIWEMLRYARLEAVSGRPSSYYELNQEYRAWIEEAANSGCNLGVIRGMKEKWGSKKDPKTGVEKPFSTGTLEARGMKEIPELVQVSLDHKWVEGEGFVIKVMEKCRLNGTLMGQEFTDLDFTTLATLLYPETSPEDWE